MYNFSKSKNGFGYLGFGGKNVKVFQNDGHFLFVKNVNQSPKPYLATLLENVKNFQVHLSWAQIDCSLYTKHN